MNKDEREQVNAFKEQVMATLRRRWKATGVAPDPGCPRCFGTGEGGFNFSTGKYLQCRCVKKEKKDDEQHSAQSD